MWTLFTVSRNLVQILNFQKIFCFRVNWSLSKLTFLAIRILFQVPFFKQYFLPVSVKNWFFFLFHLSKNYEFLVSWYYTCNNVVFKKVYFLCPLFFFFFFNWILIDIHKNSYLICAKGEVENFKTNGLIVLFFDIPCLAGIPLIEESSIYPEDKQ